MDRREDSSLYTTTLLSREVTCTFEAGDWLSYLSSGRGTHEASYWTTISDEGELSFDSTTDVKLETGSLTVTDTERVTEAGIERHLAATGDAQLGDLVARFVVADASDLRAEIDGHVFDHRGLNRYLQYRTDSVSLVGNDGRISFRAVKTAFPDNFELVCYARDQPDGCWAIHVRGLSYDLDSGFVRFYWGPWSRSKIADSVASLRPVARRLLYLRERLTVSRLWDFVPFHMPLQYVSTIPLAEDDTLSLSVKVGVTDD
jgi:hypothetical protein